MCDTVAGRFDEADRRFAAALALEESVGGTALAARTKYWWARMLDTSGDHDRARTIAAEAHATATALAMTALAAAATRLVRPGPAA